MLQYVGEEGDAGPTAGRLNELGAWGSARVRACGRVRARVFAQVELDISSCH